MNKEDTKKILQVLRINYPNSFKQLSNEDTYAYLDLWHEAFKDDDPRLVAHAVKSIIYSTEREFAPNIGQVKSMMLKLTQPEELTEQEAWQLVMNASKNGIHGAKKEFEKLPPVIQSVLGSYTTIREYAVMDIQQLNTVVASNFMRSYKARSKSEREYQALPSETKNFIASVTSKFKMIEDKKEDDQPTYRVIKELPKY